MELLSSKVKQDIRSNQRVQDFDIQFRKLKKLTKQIDLFNGVIKYILVPICENDHWSLAVICNPHKAEDIFKRHI